MSRCVVTPALASRRSTPRPGAAQELPTLCFKNLPIEFDANGNATLKPGATDPYSYAETPLATPIEDDPQRMKELFARNGAVRRVDFDPVTRVAGALAFHTVVDLDKREVLETASMATLFRGYEIILQGRDPRD